jgi:hypothetical protein
MSRALALVLLLATAAVASPAGVGSIPGAAGAKMFADGGSVMKSAATSAVGADPAPAPIIDGMPADPAPDARG